MKKRTDRSHIYRALFVTFAFALMVLVSSLFMGNTLNTLLIRDSEISIDSLKTNMMYLRDVEISMDAYAQQFLTAAQDGASICELRQLVYDLGEMVVNPDDHPRSDVFVYFNTCDGLFLSASGRELPEGVLVSELKWYQEAQEVGEAVALAFSICEETEVSIVSLVKQYFDNEGNPFCIVGMDFTVEWMSSYFAFTTLAKAGSVMLLDKKLDVVVHPDEALIGSSIRCLTIDYITMAEELDRSGMISSHSLRMGDNTYIAFFRVVERIGYVGILTPRNLYYEDIFYMAVYMSILGAVMATVLIIILSRLHSAKSKMQDESLNKSYYLATMSHEIRTPMNAIIGMVQMQLQKEDLPDEYAEELGKIYNSGIILLGIINDILDISRIETGKLKLEPMEYDMPSFISDAVQINVVRIGSKPIEFILDVDKNLPLRAIGDELRLKQILNNLLSNAIKYTAEGYVRLSVSYLPDERGYFAMRFTIEDTGEGINPENLKNLFTEFSRFNFVDRRTIEGSGLGLSITKRLVDMMGGQIDVVSDFGKGSIFTVTVKQKAVVCPVIGEELSNQFSDFTFVGDNRHTELQFARESMPYGRVLVVDDVDTNVYVARGLLSTYGLNIETAASGLAAIEKVESGNTYDAIFMDHMMPVMDGIEATQRLRASGYKGAIIALTANAIIGNAEMFLQNGFDNFISKPIDLQRLDEVLKKYIRDRHTDKPNKAEANGPAIVAPEEKRSIDPKLIQLFLRGAKRMTATMRETVSNGDTKLFATTAHAMRSSLVNVGEKTASEAAYALEKASADGDLSFIKADLESFFETLEEICERLRKLESAHTGSMFGANGSDGADIVEDTDFLVQQLRIVKAACDNYDDTAAYSALDTLKEKKLKPQTAATLEQIHDLLYLDSDFEGASELIDTVTNQYL